MNRDRGTEAGWPGPPGSAELPSPLPGLQPWTPFIPHQTDPIHWLSKDLRATFGGPIRKVGLDLGGTCPNRDGTLGTGGCSWCDPGGSGPDGGPAGEEWPKRLARLTDKALQGGAVGTVAYFQAYSSTYGLSPGALEDMARRALAVPGVLGLAVSTRPDCLPSATLDVLQRLGRSAFLWVEIGMQTACDATLAAMNRGHVHERTVEAMDRLHGRGLPTVLHLILGLPGEDAATIRASLLEAARLRPWGVKLHPLHVVEGSALARPWREGALRLPALDDYVSLAADALELLPPQITVHRLTGERAEGVLLAPEWCRDKRRVLGCIGRELSRRGSWQGHGSLPGGA